MKEIMSDVDENKDGIISYDEFNDALTEMLRRSVKMKNDK